MTHNGIETYVNDEPDDLNPGIIVDTAEWNHKALDSAGARRLAQALVERAEYYDQIQGTTHLQIGGVEYSKTLGDGPPDQAQIHLIPGVTITAYVQEGRTLIIEIDGDIDGEQMMVPFKVYRNDGLLWEEGKTGES